MSSLPQESFTPARLARIVNDASLRELRGEFQECARICNTIRIEDTKTTSDALAALAHDGISPLYQRNVHNLLALHYIANDQYDEAARHLGTAEAICASEGARGFSHDSLVDVCGVLGDTAALDLLRGHLTDGERTAKRAKFMVSGAHRPDAAAVCAANISLGHAAFARGDILAAESLFSSAAHASRHSVRPESVAELFASEPAEFESDSACSRATAQGRFFLLSCAASVNLSRAQLANGEPETARDTATDAVESLAAALGHASPHPGFATALVALSGAHLASGDAAAGHACAEFAAKAFLGTIEGTPWTAIATRINEAVTKPPEVAVDRLRLLCAALECASSLRESRPTVVDLPHTSVPVAPVRAALSVARHNLRVAETALDDPNARGVWDAPAQSAWRGGTAKRVVDIPAFVLGLGLRDTDPAELQWDPTAEARNRPPGSGSE